MKMSSFAGVNFNGFAENDAPANEWSEDGKRCCFK
jgi:hypothetical protein